MEQQMAQELYAELNKIRETLQTIQKQVEQLATFIVTDNGRLEVVDYLSIVGLGASGMNDVSEQHDSFL
jgi:hypothetical protein